MSDLMLIMLRWLVTLGQIVIAIFLPDPPPALSPGSISAVSFIDHHSETVDRRIITDPDDIKRFVDFVNRLKTRWCPASAPMGGDWGVVLRIGDEDVTSFSISPGSIYSRSKSGVIYRDLSEDHWAEFESILATAEIVPRDLRFELPIAEILPTYEVSELAATPLAQVSFPWMRALGCLGVIYLGSFMASIAFVGAVERSERLIWFIRIAYAPLICLVQFIDASAGALRRAR